MIRYALRCEEDHRFEGWFRDSATFERQSQAGELGCPVCGSTSIDKALMAPAVTSSAAEPVTLSAEAQPARAPAATPARPLHANDPRAQALLEMMRTLRRQVVENAEYVGNRFTEEARRIHDGESEQRGIYGEATLEDAAALREEGIDVMPLPVLPEDRN